MEKSINYYLFGILLLIPVLFITCDSESPNYYYVFINETSHTIYISVSDSYRIREQEGYEYISKNTRIILYDRETWGSFNRVSISVRNNGTLDFKWTTDSETDNAKIYSVVNGNNATFREK